MSLLLCLCAGLTSAPLPEFGAVAAAAAPAAGEGKSAGPVVDLPVASWLLLGPVGVRLPAFSDTTGLARRAEVVLGTDYLDLERTLPTDGDRTSWQPGTILTWRKVETRDSAVVVASAREVTSLDTALVHVSHMACYVDCPRWQKLELVLKTRQRAAVYLDGKLVKRKNGATPGEGAPEEFSCELALTRDKHLLLVKTVFDRRDPENEWAVAPFLRLREDARRSAPVPSLSPAHRFSMDDMMKMRSVRQATLSPDGLRAALIVSEPDLKRNVYVSHLSVVDAKTGAEVYALKTDNGVSSPEWAPDSRRLAFVASAASDRDTERGRGGGADLWLVDLTTRNMEKLVSERMGLGGVTWSPEGDYLYFTAWERGSEVGGDTQGGGRWRPESKRPYEKLEELHERWEYWKHKSHLFVLSLESRTEVQLTTGEFTVGRYELSPGGEAVAFLRSIPVKARPFFETQLWRLDTRTLAID
ncbi:MAG: hypothetical protein JW952_04980, partial [Candidatus Eisenbacteria bacterium]|nr:hypothetical protein [Candidatus Eisenbacteria bacterium]